MLRRRSLMAIRQQLLPREEDAIALTSYDGTAVEWRDVEAELMTLSLFGDRRVVFLEGADKFVTSYRTELEDYVESPCSASNFVLEVTTLPKTTRLYKAIVAGGLVIDCASPKDREAAQWICAWAKKTHRVQLSAGTAETLLDMVGPELGLVDREIEKLALSVGEDGEITDKVVIELAGDWRAKTAWDMLDMILSGNMRGALDQFDRLLTAGEQPIVVLAQFSSSLRRLAAAARIVVQAEAEGKRVSVGDALGRVGVKPFFLRKSESQLRWLGRERALALPGWLLEADLALKGRSNLSPRMVLEGLFLKLGQSVEVVSG